MHREACPLCRAEGGDTSGDNLLVYDDAKYCHVHGVVERTSDTGQSKPPKPDMTERIHTEKRPDLTWKGLTSWDWLPNAGTNVVVFPLVDAATGTQRGVKTRNLDREDGNKNNSIRVMGNNPPLCVVPGTQGKSEAVIVEGETAAYSAASLRQYTVYFLPGAGNERRLTEAHYSALMKHERVILALDNDAPGIKASETLKANLPSFLVSDITQEQTRKDVNDYLDAGDVQAWLSLVLEAPLLGESPFHTEESLEAMRSQSKVGFTTGNKKLDLMMGGAWSVGSFKVLTGDKGAGKSTFTSWLAAQLVKHNEHLRLLYITTEMREDKVLDDVQSSLLGKHLSYSLVPVTQVEKANASRLTRERMRITRRSLVSDFTSTQAVILQAVRMGSNVVILDVLNDLMTDERQEMDRRAKWFSDLAQGSLDPSLPPVLVLAVAHKKVTDAQTRAIRGRKIHPDELLGGRALIRHPSHMLAVARDAKNHMVTTFHIVSSRDFNLYEDEDGNSIDYVHFEYLRRNSTYEEYEQHDHQQDEQDEGVQPVSKLRRRASTQAEPDVAVRTGKGEVPPDTRERHSISPVYEPSNDEHPDTTREEAMSETGADTSKLHTGLPRPTDGEDLRVQGVPDTAVEEEVPSPEVPPRDTSRDVNPDLQPPRFTPANHRLMGIPAPSTKRDNWQLPQGTGHDAAEGHREVAQRQRVQSRVRRVRGNSNA